ncbi:MAG: hypothetical protein K9N23_23430 [Akkermansiaceae bacterium]|nr:hypothetical protein [Akkermansiaceae bacterium]
MKPKTHSELAKIHGISRQTVSTWSKSGVNIQNASAMKKKVAAMTNRLEGAHDISSARLEKLRAETDRIKHALEVDRQLFVSASQQYAAGEMAGQTIKLAIQKMNSDLPPMLAGRTAVEISTILKRYTRNVLVELSQYQSPITEQLKP